MKSIKFEKLVQFIAFIKSIELPLNSRFFVKTSSFSAIFIHNFPTTPFKFTWYTIQFFLHRHTLMYTEWSLIRRAQCVCSFQNFIIYITKHNIQFLHYLLLIFNNTKTVSYATIFLYFKDHYIDDKTRAFFNVTLPTNMSNIYYNNLVSWELKHFLNNSKQVTCTCRMVCYILQSIVDILSLLQLTWIFLNNYR